MPQIGPHVDAAHRQPGCLRILVLVDVENEDNRQHRPAKEQYGAVDLGAIKWWGKFRKPEREPIIHSRNGSV